ncbi:MAG: hypothetical protein Q8Q80_16265 [Methyloversatilis sp.]|uniref:hypothetical protein n=1 Tax=Methyloversatilis sp. TaxID=2569862 RepID=UPI0027358F09|nr:hypothetical protein [Methyloversatilis sp.]MDP3874214.1 hypothetical protein [Methyloversatilis sp.]
MSCKVFVRPEAERDLASSYAFYQECRRGLGEDFLSSVEESFERISKNPFLYPDVHRGIPAPVSLWRVLSGDRRQDFRAGCSARCPGPGRMAGAALMLTAH